MERGKGSSQPSRRCPSVIFCKRMGLFLVFIWTGGRCFLLLGVVVQDVLPVQISRSLCRDELLDIHMVRTTRTRSILQTDTDYFFPTAIGYCAAAAKSLQSCLTLCDPIDGSPPGSPLGESLGFSRQEHWSGLTFPSPVHESEKWKWSRSVMSDLQRPHGLQPFRLLHPWDFPGKSTGVGCHCLLRRVLWVLWIF